MNEALARGDTEAAKKARDDMAAAEKAEADHHMMVAEVAAGVASGLAGSYTPI
jgi:hypothetical protein